MASIDDYRQRPLEERLARLARTPDEVAAAVGGRDDSALSRRPAPKSWAPKEVVCHLRDLEELFTLRFHMMLGTDEPTFLTVGDLPPAPARWGITGPLGLPLDPDRWAEERQYLRHDTAAAVAALRRRRGESLALLRALSPEQWRRGSLHLIHGRMTFADWTCLMAAHDDKHLDQLHRALAGRA